MKAQYENKVISSVLLWLDNAVCTKGEAFTDHGSSFYDVGSQWYGYYSYGAPYKQFVPDFSIPDSAPTSPQIPTGVHVSGVFRPKGVSGLVDIDYGNGHVYFDHEIAEGQISGDYAVKDFNIYLTNKMEQDLGLNLVLRNLMALFRFFHNLQLVLADLNNFILSDVSTSAILIEFRLF